jgi:hypothetical protein
VDVFFSWGVGGGEEETPGHVLLSRFHRTTRVSEQPFLCSILYSSMCQTITNSFRRLCMHIILLRTGGGTQDTVLYIVRGVRGLGIRMLTLDTKTSLYDEDQGFQVPMVLDHETHLKS